MSSRSRRYKFRRRCCLVLGSVLFWWQIEVFFQFPAAEDRIPEMLFRFWCCSFSWRAAATKKGPLHKCQGLHSFAISWNWPLARFAGHMLKHPRLLSAETSGKHSKVFSPLNADLFMLDGMYRKPPSRRKLAGDVPMYPVPHSRVMKRVFFF